MKILILYVTVHGATADCAHRLAAALGENAEVCELKYFFGDLSQYDCIIAGAPVYAGSIPKDMRTYCRENRDTLEKKPFAVFFSCLSEDKNTIQEYLRHNFPGGLAEHAFACDSFGGAFYFTKLNPLERTFDRTLAKAYAKASKTKAPDGTADFVMISGERITAFADRVKKAVKLPA